MYIADWNDGVFMEQLVLEKYVENLKRANVKSTMICFVSYVGKCYYLTGRKQEGKRSNSYLIEKYCCLWYEDKAEVQFPFTVKIKCARLEKIMLF